MARTKTPEFTGRIAWIERLNSSVNGNPRYRVSFVNGPVRKTQPDAGISYGLTNPEYQDVDLDVYTTPSGMIYDLRPAS